MAISRNFGIGYPYGKETHNLMRTLFYFGIADRDTYEATWSTINVFVPGVYQQVVIINTEENNES